MGRRPQSVNCTACSWTGARQYHESSQLTRGEIEGFGTCPKCGAVVVKRRSHQQAIRDAKAKADCDRINGN